MLSYALYSSAIDHSGFLSPSATCGSKPSAYERGAAELLDGEFDDEYDAGDCCEEHTEGIRDYFKHGWDECRCCKTRLNSCIGDRWVHCACKHDDSVTTAACGRDLRKSGCLDDNSFDY